MIGLSCLLVALAQADVPDEPQRVSTDADGGRGRIPRSPATAVARSGWELAVWNQDGRYDNPEVWGRLVDVNGVPARAPFRISQPDLSTSAPTVAARGNHDEFLVLWGEDGILGGGIRGRRVSAEGGPLGESFRIAAEASEPAIAYHARRREFLVVWSGHQSGRSEIYGARLPAGARRMPAAFRLSPPGSPDVPKARAAVAYDSARSRYLAVWELASGDEPSPQARIVPGDPRKPLGRVRQVPRARDQRILGADPEVTYSARTDEYVAAWTTPGARARRIRADGRPYGREVALGRGGSFERTGSPDVAANSRGRYMAVFSGNRSLDDEEYAVFARRLSADLSLGALRQVSTEDSQQVAASASAIAHSRAQGRFRVVWIERRMPASRPQLPDDPQPEYDVFTRGL
jgi:hypothetical protein